jgi:hypothetical protein
VADWRSLAHRTIGDLEAAGIQLLLNHTAHTIHPSGNRVAVTDPRGRQRFLPYDRLVVATGAMPARPPIPGLELPGVHLLHTMGDTFAPRPRRHPGRAGPDPGAQRGRRGRSAHRRGTGGARRDRAHRAGVTAIRGGGGQRIDIPAAALFHGMTVEGRSDFDLSDTPPFGSPWDAVQMAAQTWTRHTHGRIPTQAPSHQDGNTSTSTVPPPRS